MHNDMRPLHNIVRAAYQAGLDVGYAAANTAAGVMGGSVIRPTEYAQAWNDNVGRHDYTGQGQTRRDWMGNVALGSAVVVGTIGGLVSEADAFLNLFKKKAEAKVSPGKSLLSTAKDYSATNPLKDINVYYRDFCEDSDILPHAKMRKTDTLYFTFKNQLLATDYLIPDLYDPKGDGPAVRDGLQNMEEFQVGGVTYSFDFNQFMTFMNSNRKKIRKLNLDRNGYMYIQLGGNNILIPIDPEFVKFYDAL